MPARESREYLSGSPEIVDAQFKYDLEKHRISASTGIEKQRIGVSAIIAILLTMGIFLIYFTDVPDGVADKLLVVLTTIIGFLVGQSKG
ncbi:MAG: hypothetical protein HYS81_04835 [Candidatus Aenigmatarchaeota archaeon]|nr:MAG: hypothetical protein HYS81_04835 [Candidatus Aenigmarchaeota archaeon]